MGLLALLQGQLLPSCNILVGKFEERIPFERLQLTWEGNIKLVLEN
jgi:hypothetical protein